MKEGTVESTQSEETVRKDMALTVKEAAERAGLHYQTIRWWCATGRLPATNMGRYYLIWADDLDKTVAKETTGVGRPRGWKLKGRYATVER
jgi:excisionase family DNA binding protein